MKYIASIFSEDLRRKSRELNSRLYLSFSKNLAWNTRFCVYNKWLSNFSDKLHSHTSQLIMFEQMILLKKCIYFFIWKVEVQREKGIPIHSGSFPWRPQHPGLDHNWNWNLRSESASLTWLTGATMWTSHSSQMCNSRKPALRVKVGLK